MGRCQNDTRRFVELCLEGRLYERLVELTGYDRATVKRRFFAVAYGRPWQAAGTVLGRAFRGEFPSVWAEVCRLNAADHGALARRMQTVESYLVVWRACARIREEFPAAPLFTLHDCLLGHQEQVGAFADILAEEYRAVFGVEPRLSTKPF